MRFSTAPHRCRGGLKRRSWKQRLPIWSVPLILRSTIVSPDLHVIDISANIESGTGAVTATPSDVWEGEMNRNFILTYTAEGQMYRSAIQVKIPDSLIPDAGTAEEEAAFIESKLTISQSGNVVFGNAADINSTDDEDATVTIYIDSMNAGDSVSISYPGINVQALDVDLNTEELEVIGADNDGPGHEAFEVFTDSDGDAQLTFTGHRVGEPVGRIHPQQGSGDAKLTPESVQVGSTQNIILDYISHTTLENVYIWIYTPHNYAVDTEDPAFVMANGEEILLTATGDYGYLSSTGLPAGATQVIVDGGKGAVWGPLSFNRGDTFSRTIHNVAITDKPGAYTWDVHLATVDPVDRAGVVDGIGERNPNGLLGLTWSNHLVSPDLHVLPADPSALSFTSTLPAGISLFHVPLDDDTIDTVGDLRSRLGGSNVTFLAGIFDGAWDLVDDDMTITPGLGLYINLLEKKEVTFTGSGWGNGSSMINLKGGGLNLIGLPVNDDRVAKISDIMSLFDPGVVTHIIVLSDNDEFQLVTSASDSADGEVAGDTAYVVHAATDASINVMGDGWTNGGAAGAAPIALAGYTVDNQTPALAIHGSVVDEITGVSREGFRVKVKNLSTKAALSKITSAETGNGYSMIFVDLVNAHAARVGDVLEISADSPNPLIGVQPVRHIVTAHDVKNSNILLENLIAYEIPAETQLLRNYPNPFNPETWIPYHLSKDADVSLTIYDVDGEVVRTIDVGHQTAARYDSRAKAIYWDGRNRFGEQVASGIYFYHLSAGDFSETRKMVILK